MTRLLFDIHIPSSDIAVLLVEDELVRLLLIIVFLPCSSASMPAPRKVMALEMVHPLNVPEERVMTSPSAAAAIASERASTPVKDESVSLCTSVANWVCAVACIVKHNAAAINKIAFFMLLNELNKKRRATIRCLFSYPGYRQVTINVNKQEQFTPIGREPSELLALTLEYFAGIR